MRITKVVTNVFEDYNEIHHYFAEVMNFLSKERITFKQTNLIVNKDEESINKVDRYGKPMNSSVKVFWRAALYLLINVEDELRVTKVVETMYEALKNSSIKYGAVAGEKLKFKMQYLIANAETLLIYK